jgi:hypothetical protein
MSIFKVSTAKQNSQVISLPERCATLVYYDDYQYTYNLSITVNPLLAVRQGALIIEYSLINENTTNQRSFNYFKNKTSLEIVTNLRKISGLVKDNLSLTSSETIIIKTPNNQLIDISSYISNAEIAQLRRGILPARNVQRIVTKSVATLNAQNNNVAVTTINNNNPSIPGGYGPAIINSSLVSKQMNDILYEGRIDPGSIWNNTNTYVSSQNTIGGVIPRKPYTSRQDVTYDPRLLNIISSQLTNIRLPQEQKKLSAGDYVTVSESIPLTELNINQIITIPRTSIGKNNFTLRFKVKDAVGKIYQIVEYSVKHGININNFMPTTPPYVQTIGLAKQGNVSFQVTQRDIYASGISVYRRQINPNNPLLNSQYTKINDINLPGNGNNTTVYVDRSAASVNNYVYRFIPYNSDEIKAAVYTGVAIKMNRGSVNPNEPYLRIPNCGVLDYKSQKNSIDIMISLFPEKTIELRIYRRNLTKKQKTYSLIATKSVANLANSSCVINDAFVSDYNIYEYKVDLVNVTGSVATIPNTLVVEHVPLQLSSAICQVSNLKTNTQSGNVDVTFDISYQIQEDNFELLRKLLREQNLLAEYQSDISLDKERIKTFLSYAVIRTNLTTGQIENFGILTSTSFSDRQFGPSKSVLPLNPANKYRYTVVVYTRSPDTLFENLERTVSYDVISIDTSGTRLTKTASYTYRPYKWLQPLVLKTGNLISQDKHSQIGLAQGYVVDRKYVDIAFNPEPYPQIANVIATQIQERSILIEWSVNGSLQKIDHFIIKNEISGIKNIIGSAHNLSSTGGYKFLYNLLSNEAGAITFSIIPVYYDYTFGTESATNTLVI